MSVGQICERWVDIAAPHETIQQAAERMHQHTVGALVIVGNGNVPVGIVTDRDLVIRGVAHRRDADTTRLSDVMSTPVTTVLEDSRSRPPWRSCTAGNAGGYRSSIATSRWSALSRSTTSCCIWPRSSLRFKAWSRVRRRAAPLMSTPDRRALPGTTSAASVNLEPNSGRRQGSIGPVF